MNCDRLLQIHRRIRVARASAIGGGCAIARRLIANASRDLQRDKHAGTGSPGARALAKGVGQFLPASQRHIREECGPRGGDR